MHVEGHLASGVRLTEGQAIANVQDDLNVVGVSPSADRKVESCKC